MTKAKLASTIFAVNAKKLIRLPKVVAKAGEWKVVTGKAKMPPSAFPLSKTSSYRLGRGWHWRVDLLAADGFPQPLRLLTAFEPDAEEFLAWLSTPVAGAHILVGQYEFHGTHPGWHCHAICGDIADIPVADPRPRAFRRLPGGFKRHREAVFEITESSALGKAFGFFKVTGTPGGSLL